MNCRSRRKQTSMGCWDQPHCIVLDPVLLPAAIFVEQWEPWGQCHLLSGSCSWRSAPLALPGMSWFPDKWTFSCGACGSLLTLSWMTIEINPLIYFSLWNKNKFWFHLCSRHAQLSVLFWVCCWDFFGKNSKNSLEFNLYIISGLEELLLHKAQFPSPVFIPWASCRLCLETMFRNSAAGSAQSHPVQFRSHTRLLLSALERPTSHAQTRQPSSGRALVHTASAWSVCGDRHLTVLTGPLSSAEPSAGIILVIL